MKAINLINELVPKFSFVQLKSFISQNRFEKKKLVGHQICLTFWNINKAIILFKSCQLMHSDILINLIKINRLYFFWVLINQKIQQINRDIVFEFLIELNWKIFA